MNTIVQTSATVRIWAVRRWGRWCCSRMGGNNLGERCTRGLTPTSTQRAAYVGKPAAAERIGSGQTGIEAGASEQVRNQPAEDGFRESRRNDGFSDTSGRI